jgi:hypothetical protein
VLVAESLTKDSLFAAIQQRLSGMSNIINFWFVVRVKKLILKIAYVVEQ